METHALTDRQIAGDVARESLRKRLEKCQDSKTVSKHKLAPTLRPYFTATASVFHIDGDRGKDGIVIIAMTMSCSLELRISM